MYPNALGIIKRKGNNTDIDLSCYGIGDNYAGALSKSLLPNNQMRNVNLRSNRLSDFGTYDILN